MRALLHRIGFRWCKDADGLEAVDSITGRPCEMTRFTGFSIGRWWAIGVIKYRLKPEITINVSGFEGDQ